MIQRKQISVLAAAAAVLLLAVLIVQMRDRVYPVEAGLLFPDLGGQLNEVTELAISSGTESFSVRKAEVGWTVADKAGYPAKFEAVKTALVALAGLKAIEPKTTNPDNYAKLRLEDAAGANGDEAKSRRLTVSGPSGTLADLIVGKRRFGRGGGSLDMLYVRKAGEAQAWLAEGRLNLEIEPLNWLRREIVSIDRDRVAEVSITRPTGEVLVISKATPEDQDYTVHDMPPGAKLKSTADVDYIASALYGLRLDDVRAAVDLVGSEDAGSARFRTFDGLVLEISLWRQGEETWTQYAAGTTGAEASEEAVAESVALNDALGAWAYRVPSYKLSKFESTLAGLLEEEEAGGGKGGP